MRNSFHTFYLQFSIVTYLTGTTCYTQHKRFYLCHQDHDLVHLAAPTRTHAAAAAAAGGVVASSPGSIGTSEVAAAAVDVVVAAAVAVDTAGAQLQEM